MQSSAKVFGDAFRGGIRPDPQLTVSEWADEFRRLSQKASAEPGRWRTDRTPYLREIMDCLSPMSPIHEVVFMKGSQIGGSEAGFNWLAFLIHRAPGPIMMVQPTVELAERISKQRIAPMIEECPVLKDLVKDPRSRDSGNTLLMKEFPGGMLLFAGANSAAGLRSMPIKFLMMDEVDAYPKDVNGEGSPVRLAQKRTSTFSRRKIFKVSSPTYSGASEIETAFQASDQRYFHVPCPKCGHLQIIKWSNIRWIKNDRGKPIHSSAHMVCAEESCKAKIEEHHKGTMLAGGKWIPSNHGSAIAGFHLSGLYSPLGWYSWADAVEEWYGTKSDPAKLKVFINTVLGETYKIKGEDAPEWRDIYDRAEEHPLGVVPMRAVMITGAVDVQKDRLEMKVVGWNRREAWVVDRIVIPGDTALPPGHGPWKDLDALLDRDWAHESGNTMRLRLTLIDSGYNTTRVYEFVRSKSASVIRAIKGKDTLSMPIGSPSRVELRSGPNGKRLRSGIRLWPVGTNILKSDMMGRLKVKRPTDSEIEQFGFPPTYIHFPKLDEEYFKQLTSEQLVLVKARRGHAQYQWVKTYPNNEALDLFCYNIAAWYALGLQKWTEEQWRLLEGELGVPALQLRPTAPPPAAASPAPKPSAKRSTPAVPRRKRESIWG